jgi:ABC-type sugar transport system ATPase subunit
MSRLIVEMKNISKNFRHIRAVCNASLGIEEGRITAIIGDNGSGKSTLIKILSGNIRPDEGVIVIDGRKYSFLEVKQAMDDGISTVYQDLALDNNKNSVENIFLGRELTRCGILDRREMMKRAEKLLISLNIGIQDLEVPASNLSGGQRQGLAIARALNYPSRLLILDEPTAAMGFRESRNTIDMLKRLKSQGMTQLIISHNLHHVFEIADRIYVMRSGEILMACETANTTEEEIQRMILSTEAC